MTQLILVLCVSIAGVAMGGNLSKVETADLLEELEARVGARAQTANAYFSCPEGVGDTRHILTRVINDAGKIFETSIGGALTLAECQQDAAMLNIYKRQVNRLTEWAVCESMQKKDGTTEHQMQIYVATASGPHVSLGVVNSTYRDLKSCRGAARSFNTPPAPLPSN